MKIELKPLTEADFSLIVEWVNAHDEDFIYQWAGNTYSYPLTVKQIEDHYSKGINAIDAGVFIYKIIDTSTQETIGSVQLCRMDLIKSEAVVGRFLIKSEQYRGIGIGTTVLKELVRIGFEEFSLKRIKLNVFHINTQAIRCYEKVGFIKGQIHQNVYQSLTGESWNGIEMTLEKELWE
ncbi:GNAT family N-acetyltransferase [Paenibacillus wynnii]|uniref:GNAT family N-acetyltransferase n=1 Tax=Paenibacillus wynnii TaxID=268407 RepID=UPI0027926314|nr:GNAT family protein [Paenibacillus wynnii]MDQ0194581.1 RimJ/RimL family protein N-acetyltransferase [Paenibacillus wynnii]